MDPIAIPSPFGEGSPLSARLLNGLQEEILRQLYEHTHAGGIQGPQLETVGYSDRSVTEPKLADGAVSGRTLRAGAVGPGNLAADSVTENAIADGAVGNAQLADDAVSEGKLDPNVRLKLNRIGGGVSSASTIIWRDPLIVFRPTDGVPSLIETFFLPEQVFWTPPMIGFNENDIPFRLNPKVDNQNVLDAYDLFEGSRLENEEPVLAQIVNDSVQIASQEIGLVGAFQLRDAQLAVRGGTPGVGGSSPRVVEVPEERFRDVRRDITGAPRLSADIRPGAADLASAATTARTSSTSTASFARSAEFGAGGSFDAAAAAATLSLTQNGAKAAARMTTVGVVGPDGAPVAPGTEGAFTVSSGFSGKNDFLDDGPAIDYRSVGNEADRRRAAKGAGDILYNLGLDDEYLLASGHKLNDADLRAFSLLRQGNDQYFELESSFRGPQSWLADLLNNPQLFGSGYSISGGRNILSVTRMVSRDQWVRVRFITAYKNSSYAVSVTPSFSRNSVVIPQIRQKTPQYCDLQFYLFGGEAGLTQTNKVSFDLAVFGDLTTAE